MSINRRDAIAGAIVGAATLSGVEPLAAFSGQRLPVVFVAAGADRGVVTFNDTFMGLRLSGCAFAWRLLVDETDVQPRR